MTDAKTIIEFIDEQILTEQSSWAIQEIVNDLPEDQEDAAAVFCKQFELGNWFWEALVFNGVDISAVLINIGARKEQEEREASEAQREIDHEMRRAQGMPC